MANNDEIPLSAIDGVTPESGRRREGHPVIPPMADLETFPGGQSRDARDKRGRSYGHSRSPDGHRRRRESHARRLEHKLRDQDAVIRRMAAEMEDLKRHVKGKGVAEVGDHNIYPAMECGQPRTVLLLAFLFFLCKGIFCLTSECNTLFVNVIEVNYFC
ncbi:hypothetical protein CsSME_00034847 [Camellia sinensis var. sinensis]